MIQRTIAKIAGMIPVLNDHSAFSDVSIKGVSINSRTMEPGNLFVPFKGEQTDGHRYVEDALRKGAAAALWQKDVPNPPLHLPILVVEDTLKAVQQLSEAYRNELDIKVAGITGSNGKTTVKDMTARLLSLKYKVQKTEGNYNNHLGLPLTLLSLEEDTEVAVLEMGMSGFGEIEFLTKLARPDVVMITNIGESHLQDLGSRAGIAKAKLEIIEGLKDDGMIIYHGDEPLLKDRLAGYSGPAEIRSFGQSSSNSVYPVKINQEEKGSVFQTNLSDMEYHLPVLGVHNVMNALCAMEAARFLGVPYEQMNEGFASLKLTAMRMELSEGSKGEKIINDAYNASPTSMRAAIDLVSELSGYSRKVLVLADMLELGDDEVRFHREIGQAIDPEKIDYVLTFGALGSIIAEGAQEAFSEERVFAFSEKGPLIEKLQSLTSEETIVLFKGSRGMKLEEAAEALK
ncbi:UDP-N-acetylmuramoyl-tripeptide--D-alanyl-D-alanine ligase [Bacillus infantis]|uniref:UDP-N-acetylmuramoyl-tripeptide--D-alanyl-D- alanine ligase n=1 Tax=Bacillus infantis TaxID=324767 RepID=UPI003CF059F7